MSSINIDARLIKQFINLDIEDKFNKIIPGLYLGNYDTATNVSFIVNNNIKLVINCSIDLAFPNFYKEMNDLYYLRVPVNDSKSKIDQLIMSLSLMKICNIIHKYLINNENVYVHCYAGMQRSATVVFCYLIYRDKITKQKILPLKYYYDFLKSKRIIVFFPEPTFKEVIQNFYSTQCDCS